MEYSCKGKTINSIHKISFDVKKKIAFTIHLFIREQRKPKKGESTETIYVRGREG